MLWLDLLASNEYEDNIWYCSKTASILWKEFGWRSCIKTNRSVPGILSRDIWQNAIVTPPKLGAPSNVNEEDSHKKRRVEAAKYPIGHSGTWTSGKSGMGWILKTSCTGQEAWWHWWRQYSTVLAGGLKSYSATKLVAWSSSLAHSLPPKLVAHRCLDFCQSWGLKSKSPRTQSLGPHWLGDKMLTDGLDPSSVGSVFQDLSSLDSVRCISQQHLQLY